MNVLLACLLTVALCCTAPLTGAVEGHEPSPVADGAPLPSLTLPADPLDLLPLRLAEAVRTPSPVAFHEAQLALVAEGKVPALAGLRPSGRDAPQPGAEPVRDAAASLAMLLERLDVRLPPAAAQETAGRVALLGSAQEALLVRVIAAYISALAAPDPLSARAHYAALAEDMVFTQGLPRGPLVIDVCGAVYIDLSFTDNVHECDYHFMLDAGGDDLYLNNAGGSIVIGPNVPFADNPVALPALAVDLGGDDHYAGSVQQGGVAGGGHGNLGGLVDVAGNDTYDTFAFHGAVNGGGYRGGVGFLVSLGGSDTYRGEVGLGGINGGAGFGGVGLLIDLDGSDTYQGHVWAFGGTNGGANDGAAALVDLGGGDDTYDGRVGGRGGVNAGNEQGVTFLVDDGGDDRFSGYAGGGGVNGSGTGEGAAWFVSLGGNNLFHGSIGRQGAVNGGATGQGVSWFLALGGGDDHYNGTIRKAGAINGGAIVGQALLLDDGGNDRYEGFIRGSGAVNGGGAWGAGHLEDRGGDDVYHATVLMLDTEEFTMVPASATNGGAHLGTGALVDHAGADLYKENGGAFVADETVVPKDGSGMQLDLAGV